jgi:hypothetical protein
VACARAEIAAAAVGQAGVFQQRAAQQVQAGAGLCRQVHVHAIVVALDARLAGGEVEFVVEGDAGTGNGESGIGRRLLRFPVRRSGFPAIHHPQHQVRPARLAALFGGALAAGLLAVRFAPAGWPGVGVKLVAVLGFVALATALEVWKDRGAVRQRPAA